MSNNQFIIQEEKQQDEHKVYREPTTATAMDETMAQQQQQHLAKPIGPAQVYARVALTPDDMKINERRQLRLYIIIFTSVLLLAIGVVVSVSLTLPNNTATSAIHSNTIPTPAPTFAHKTRDGRTCFQTPAELHLAVRFYNLDANNQTLAALYGHPISNWCTTPMTSFREVLSGVTGFNSDISGWDTSNVLDMTLAFSGATDFNQALAPWNVSRVHDFTAMFQSATSFNEPLGAWNVARATTMNSMFSASTSFNQPLAPWDVSRYVVIMLMFVVDVVKAAAADAKCVVCMCE
jgi:surface protein